MEKIKDPAMILSVANSIGLVGSTAYFYKQLEAVRLDMVKISQTLNGVVKKLAEMEKGEQNRGEALHTLNNQVKTLNESIEELPSFDEVKELDIDLDEVIAALDGEGIVIDRPSQTPRSSKRDHRNGSRRTDDYDDRSSRRSKSGPNGRREESRHDSRNSARSSRKREPSHPTRQPKIPEYDEDPVDEEDLVRTLRHGH